MVCLLNWQRVSEHFTLKPRRSGGQRVVAGKPCRSDYLSARNPHRGGETIVEARSRPRPVGRRAASPIFAIGIEAVCRDASSWLGSREPDGPSARIAQSPSGGSGLTAVTPRGLTIRRPKSNSEGKIMTYRNRHRRPLLETLDRRIVLSTTPSFSAQTHIPAIFQSLPKPDVVVTASISKGTDVGDWILDLRFASPNGVVPTGSISLSSGASMRYRLVNGECVVDFTSVGDSEGRGSTILTPTRLPKTRRALRVFLARAICTTPVTFK